MSINLTSTAQSLEVVTTQAVQTQVVASSRDQTTSGTTPVSQDTNITTAATTAIVSAPAASTQRQVDDIEISIVGAGTQGITVRKNTGSPFQLLNVLLGSQERAHFTNDQGWRVFDAFGREKGSTVGYSLIKAPTLLTSGTSYTFSAGCTAALIELWGGGGQGGGSGAGVAANSSDGSGGSAGCYTRKFVVGVPAAAVTYAIGTAGSGAAGTANGTAGGATTIAINGITYTANGGPGGLVGVAGTTSAASGAAPAAGSIAGTNGDEAHAGQTGFPGVRVLGTGGHGGTGGQSNLCSGSPGAGAIGAGAGAAATGIGNGGGGGANLSVSTQVGGVGTAGGIRIWEFTG